MEIRRRYGCADIQGLATARPGDEAPLSPRSGCSKSHVEGAEIRGRTVTLKVKYADFQQITRSRTGQALFSTRAEIEQLSYALLEPLFPVTKGIRLLGLTLSSLGEKQLESEPQLSLSF
jgi:nucleotidyltransferase/DNA polymerase involved in DNA repair